MIILNGKEFSTKFRNNLAEKVNIIIILKMLYICIKLTVFQTYLKIFITHSG